MHTYLHNIYTHTNTYKIIYKRLSEIFLSLGILLLVHAVLCVLYLWFMDVVVHATLVLCLYFLVESGGTSFGR